MTKNSVALAAVLLASTTLTGAANAGGLRVGLGFGFPLGNFVAHQHQNDYSRPSYSKPHCDKPRAVARSTRSYDRHFEPKHEVAEAPAPRPRKIVKVEKPDEEKTIEIKTAKLEDTATANDAPSIYVPDAPPSNITGTQSTPTAMQTAAVTTDTATVTTPEPVKVETPKVEKTAEVKAEDEPKKKSGLDVKRLCRRFSAAVASLIDVPCE